MFYYKAAILAAQKRWITGSSVTFKANIYTTKISEFLFKAVSENSLLSMSSIWLLVDKAFTVI